MRIFVLMFVLMSSLGLCAQRCDNYRPDNTGVVLTETILPIVNIKVDGKQIMRRNTVEASMSIIDGGTGVLNSLKQSGQTESLTCKVSLKYYCDEEFVSSDKKPYSIITPSSVSIMGMPEGREWTLLAPMSDRSMLRTALAYSLASNFSDYSPNAKLCELVLDGVYYGVYLMVSNIVDAVKGSVVEIGRNDVPLVYKSVYRPVSPSDGSAMTRHNVYYKYKSNTVSNTDKEIAAFEQSFLNDTWKTTISLDNFADYILINELAHNADAYRLYTPFYKGDDGLIRNSLGAFEYAFGNNYAMEGYRSDTWVFESNNILDALDDPQLVPFYWTTLVNDADYRAKLKSRWQEYRSTFFSKDNIFANIDSIADMLTTSGAQMRDSEAWPRWGVTLWPNYRVPSNYASAIEELKNWITDRLDWMDSNIGTNMGGGTFNPDNPENTTYVYSPINISSGFNADCIVEDLSLAPKNKNLHPALDGHGSCFVTSNAVSGIVLPNDNYLRGEADELYVLGNYTSDNCLYLPSMGSMGTLEFTTPQTTQQLGILLVGANKGDNHDLKVNVTVNYVTGNSASQEFTVSDWGGSNSENDYIFTYNQRYRIDAASNPEACNISFSEKRMAVDMSRAIKSVTFTSNCQADSWGYGMISIFAVSGITTVSTSVDTVLSSSEKVVQSIWSINGIKQNSMRSGINIVHYTDGTTEKILKE